MALYELALIVTPELTTQEIEKKLDQIRKKLEKVGKIKDEDVWGMRDLAYRINLQDRGFYAIFYVECDNGALNELEAEMRIDISIMRYLIMLHEDEYIPIVRLEEEGAKVEKKIAPLKEVKVEVEVEIEKEEEKPKATAKAEERQAEEVEGKFTEDKTVKKEIREKNAGEEEEPKKKVSGKKKSSLDDLDAALDKLLNE